MFKPEHQHGSCRVCESARRLRSGGKDMRGQKSRDPRPVG